MLGGAVSCGLATIGGPARFPGWGLGVSYPVP